jgi:hypothetical protein
VVTNSTVTGNKGVDGGGIAGSPTVTKSTISGNHATTDGGGISGGGSVTDSSISNNLADNGGGGTFTTSGDSLTVERSTIAGNDADFGAGIRFISAAPGVLTLTNSTVSGNQATGNAGGLIASVNNGTANILNSTVARNVADSDNDEAGDGGGVFQGGPATVNLANTIVAGNRDESTTTKHPDCEGTLSSQRYNLIGDDTGCSPWISPGLTDQVGNSVTPKDAKLAALAANGGPTLTHAPLSTSPALNKGYPGSGAGTPCPVTDQRGVPRSLGGPCDIGAYELASCRGKVINVVGTNSSESLAGTSGNDGILALGGNDSVNAGSGNDGVCGGLGNDRLSGSSGADFLDGGPGTKDRCNGGSGSDKAKACEKLVSVP